MTIIDDKKLAILFHNLYETYSKEVGWETQKSCRVKFEDLPIKNQEVMIYVCHDVKKELDKKLIKHKNDLITKWKGEINQNIKDFENNKDNEDFECKECGWDNHDCYCNMQKRAKIKHEEDEIKRLSELKDSR